MICYSLVRGRDWQQETYETSSKDARSRAAFLRKKGFQVSVSAMGPQVTSVGIVRMTLVSLYNIAGEDVPPPEKIERWRF